MARPTILDGLPAARGLAVEARVHVAAGPEGIAQAAAALIRDFVEETHHGRDRAHVALTGGSSASQLYRVWQQPAWKSAVPWQRVHLWWGDERFVPSGEPESNFGTTYRELLDSDFPMPAANVHPIPVDTAIAEDQHGDWTAAAYRTEISTEVPRSPGGAPSFDVILLGLGTDGHVLSCFPDSPALAPDAPLVLAVPAPQHIEPHLPRVTLNPTLLAAARHVVVMVPGGSKASIVKRVLAGKSVEPRELPGRLATGSNAVWLLDRGSAAELEDVPLT